MKTFVSKANQENLDQLCLAIGGGATIDKAKIWAKENNKILIAIPTTGAGATETTHSVIWGKVKHNVPVNKPITISPPFPVFLDEKTRVDTKCDIIGHLVDYLNVCSDNEMIDVGIYMGSLIEHHPTNLTHKKSYPFTLKGMPHGEAIGKVLQELNILK